MEESSTYRWVMEQGAVKELKKTLLLQGKKQFQGTPRAVKAAIEAISDLTRLEELSVRLLDAANWEELLGLPQPARRSTRRKSKS